MRCIHIIILNWNGKSDTLECLASLKNVTSPKAVLVVDNGSTDSSVEAIRAAYPEVALYESRINLGFAEGNNLGIRWALQQGAEWIFLLNNDTIVAPDVLEQLLQANAQKPQAKILGAKIYRYFDPKRIDHLGGFWDANGAEFVSPASGHFDDGACFEHMERVDYACGAALMVHRSVFEAVGLLEPKFFLYWEESDFCFRAKQKGFDTWTAPQAKVWHKVSTSFQGNKPHMHYFWWRSRLLWIERNCSAEEKHRLYWHVIYPQLWKTARHYLLRLLQHGALRLVFQTPNTKSRLKAKRNQAGLLGALHHLLRRYGNCPSWLTKKPNML